jgi:hypothetical protein
MNNPHELPAYLTEALNFKILQNERSGSHIEIAFRKSIIQKAVARAIKERAISLQRGIQILEQELA